MLGVRPQWEAGSPCSAYEIVSRRPGDSAQPGSGGRRRQSRVPNPRRLLVDFLPGALAWESKNEYPCMLGRVRIHQRSKGLGSGNPSQLMNCSLTANLNSGPSGLPI